MRSATTSVRRSGWWRSRHRSTLECRRSSRPSSAASVGGTRLRPRPRRQPKRRPTAGGTLGGPSWWGGGDRALALPDNFQYAHQGGAGLFVQDFAALLGRTAAVVVTLASGGVSEARLDRGWQWRAAIGVAIL